ncbi:unnamed protein product [Mytilus coruscus]|uniref:DZIP3-like HEPN domain-containing protein n=1 Tax=Mytilus coruscus TaxID=42192 RepID=A0A6J8D765_MYTCO|nr:unnamed protein product [Mytilus coruscus]
MAPLSEEEENYLWLALLLKGMTARAVRTYFDRNFPPTYLPSTLNTYYDILDDLKFKTVLNQTQWNLLFPKTGVPDSTTFDVTLMICLIRNLTCIAQPITGYDSLPLTVETTPGADLARIKWYRNILAHHDRNKMVTSDFNTAWSIISDTVGRLGDQQMKQECKELKVKILDQSNQEIMLEIKQLQKEMEELVLKDPISLHIRGDVDMVTWCLYHCNSNVNHCLDDGTSPLFFACLNGHTEVEGQSEVVQILINNKADINKCKDTGALPLCIACEKGRPEVVKILINNKADINKCDYVEVSPLFFAGQEGHTEVVQMLINNKANIKRCRDTGSSPLYIACYKEHNEVVKI